MADRIAVMDHGVLQQVGTPLEVYNNPANVFVARFIGSPGMNLLPGPSGRKRPRPGHRSRAARRHAAACRPLAARAARAHAGEVLYGFRPEQVSLSSDGSGLALPVTLRRAHRRAHHRPSRRRARAR